MARIDSTHSSLLVLGMLAGTLGFAGCMSAHPDEKAAVLNSLGSNTLYSVMVAQDRRHGVITLTGDVGSEDTKNQAAAVAGNAAPGYSIDNRIRVIPIGLSSPDGPVAQNKPKPLASKQSH
jgi:hyperosmotically inducible protein